MKKLIGRDKLITLKVANKVNEIIVMTLKIANKVNEIIEHFELDKQEKNLEKELKELR